MVTYSKNRKLPPLLTGMSGADCLKSTYITVTKKFEIFNNPTGNFKRLIDESRKLVALSTNDRHLEFFRLIYHVLAPSLSDEVIEDYLQKYRGVITAAFTTKKVSLINNYEALETRGDAEMRRAIKDYLSKRGITTPSVVTQMQHRLEQTRSMAEIAQKLSIDKLIIHDEETETPLSKTAEDVFESVLGALTVIEQDICARGVASCPTAEDIDEIMDMVAGVTKLTVTGRATNMYGTMSIDARLSPTMVDRFIGTILDNSTIDKSADKPPKTFITNFSNLTGQKNICTMSTNNRGFTMRCSIDHEAMTSLTRQLHINPGITKLIYEILNRTYFFPRETYGFFMEKNVIDSIAYQYLVMEIKRTGFTSSHFMYPRIRATTKGALSPEIKAKLDDLVASDWYLAIDTDALCEPGYFVGSLTSMVATRRPFSCRDTIPNIITRSCEYALTKGVVGHVINHTADTDLTHLEYDKSGWRAVVMANDSK